MKITFVKGRANPYTSRNGKSTFVYHVSGTPEEIITYKASKGEHYREDKDAANAPLFFTTNACGNTAELVKTAKGEFVADMSKEKTFASLEEQFGTTQAKEKFAEMGL